jgi:hypothetical protein
MNDSRSPWTNSRGPVTDAARRMGRKGRHRVESEFSLDRSVAAAEHAIEDVVCDRAC